MVGSLTVGPFLFCSRSDLGWWQPQLGRIFMVSFVVGSGVGVIDSSQIVWLVVTHPLASLLRLSFKINYLNRVTLISSWPSTLWRLQFLPLPPPSQPCRWTPNDHKPVVKSLLPSSHANDILSVLINNNHPNNSVPKPFTKKCSFLQPTLLQLLWLYLHHTTKRF